MNENVPIATLSGTSSLTDVLPELPFPSPSPCTAKHSLLYNTRITDEATKVLRRPDPAVVQQLARALSASKSACDQLVFKDAMREDNQPIQGGPLLLQAIMAQKANLFSHQPRQENNQGLHSEHYPQSSPLHQVPGSCLSPSQYQDSTGLVPQSSPYRRGVQPSPVHPMMSPQQVSTGMQNFGALPTGLSACTRSGTYAGPTPLSGSSQTGIPLLSEGTVPSEVYSPVKTRRMRGLSNSAPQGTDSTPLDRQTHGGSSVRRNLNKASLEELRVNSTATEPLPSVVNAMAARNGMLLPSHIYDEQVQLSHPQTGYQSYGDEVNSLQQLHNETKVPKSASRSRRKSSRSRSTENGDSLVPCNQNQGQGGWGLDGTVVCSNEVSVTTPPGWDVATIISTQDITMAPNAPLCTPRHDTPSVIALQPEVRLKPVEQHSADDQTAGINLSDISSLRNEQDVNISSTSLQHDAHLSIPKLVITRIKQRRGSREVETHKVRAVFSGEEGPAAVPTDLKRKRDSEEENEHQRRKEERKKKKAKKAQLQQEIEDIEALMDSITFRRFTTALDDLFEFDDECDVPRDIQDTDEQAPNPDSLVPRPKVMELFSETAKLKSLEVLHQVPTEQLIRLLTIMERHIRDGFTVQLSSLAEQGEEEEQRMWRDICLDRMLRSVEASLVVLNVLTSPSMPKLLYLEEVMDRIIRLTKIQLQNTIFPEYDLVYRDPDMKEGTLPISKSKRSRTSQPKVKPLVVFYNKVCALVAALGDLVDIQTLTDTAVLQVSSLGISPFFVENVSELQHSALKLVRSVFRKYEKHRELILEDIFASLARLPSSKRNLRGYRLGRDESIQMVTALVLQMIQCSVRCPNAAETSTTSEATGEEEDSKPVDRDILLIGSYETALRTARNFLSMFLSKCISVGKDEEDYRPLFENFLQDLLVMLNKPDWPAAEVFLTLLGKLLIVTFNNKTNDVSLRVSAIEYLGVIAAHLRKDAVTSQQDTDAITEVIVEQLGELSDGSSDEMSHLDERSSKRQQVLQKALAEYLNVEGHKDAAFLFARQFFLGQWMRDTHIEIERALRSPSEAPLDAGEPLSTSYLVDADSIQKLEDKKDFLRGIMDSTRNHLQLRPRSALNSENAPLVSRYLASSRSFSKSFDVYLNQILRALNESAVAIRTKSIKALSQVVSADPSILSRADMQKGVHARFVDMSTSVREAAVELIGRFVLNKPELIHQYYDMIIERILDTGISVRKRVIKILRDICLHLPDFPQITEICVKIMRRITDEEGIKDLVTKVFQQMWFSPDTSANQEALLQRVGHMTDVVSACGEHGDWFELLLENLLNNEEDSIVKASEQACQQIVRCLVENVLRQEERVVAQSEGRVSSSQKLVASLSTLYLISKVKPKHLVNHATTLQPYLSTKCNTQGDYLIIQNVARILELVVPLMEHPSETFLARLEESLMKLTVKHGQMVVQSCISCLGAVVNKVTHNIKLVKDYFQRYYGFLVKAKADLSRDPKKMQASKPTLMRSLFTLGLLCKHFEFDSDSRPQNQSSIKDKVFAVYIFFTKHKDEDICQKAIAGLGFLCMRYTDLLLKGDATKFYHNILSSPSQSLKHKLQVLKNLQTHLFEEEKRLRLQDHHWHKQPEKEKENLKELGDSMSGTTSAVMQAYLKDVLENFLKPEPSIRMAALQVVSLILRQGLVHPVQCVPYLIAIGTDHDPQVRTASQQPLTDIDNKFSGFVPMKALAGVKMSFELQKLTHKAENSPIRGVRAETSQSLLSHTYTVIRSSRQPRRSLLQSMLRLFDDHKKAKLDLLLYLADNLAHFPYVIQEEPLFIIHHVDTMLSVAGANALQAFQETFLVENRPDGQQADANDDDEETYESVLARIPGDPADFVKCCVASQPCMLLLYLKQQLKELYTLSDSKCHKYSPSEPTKAYDKNVSRKASVLFNPEQVLDYVAQPDRMRTREECAEYYCNFKMLLMRLDPAEEDSDLSDGRESPVGDPALGDGEGQPKTPGRRATKPKKAVKGRKATPATQKGKGKPKPKKKRKKISIDLDLGDEDDGSLYV